jgi:hypothetical protein
VPADAVDPRILLAACWVSLMLVYLLGDVIRIFAGQFTPGRMGDREGAEWMWIVATVVMLVPIAMILVSLTVPRGPLVWITVIAAGFLVIFNLLGLPYPGAFDNILIVVSFAVNGFTIWVALTQLPQSAQASLPASG